MPIRRLYALLCVLGIALPYSQFIPFVLQHGLNLHLFFEQLLANRISAFFGLDVLISAVVLLVFVADEGRRIRLSGIWAPVLATLLVGVSLGLPLFLYQREAALVQGR
jgi:hypothetical protein